MLALLAIALVMANAQCIENCAFRSCSDFLQHSTGSQSPCHHKAPPSNHSDPERPCAHHILPGLESGLSVQPVVQITAIHVETDTTAPVLAPWLSAVTAAFQSPPPDAGASYTLVLRI